LDVCNQRIENQAIKNLDVLYNKIVLVFEGIDYFLDKNNGREGNIAFWLPKCFPKNVKVIVTADRDSESMKYFDKLECHKVSVPSDVGIMRSMVKSHAEKELCVEGNIKNELLWIAEENLKQPEVTSLYAKAFLSCLLPEKHEAVELSETSLISIQGCLEKIDKAKLKTLRNVEEMFAFVL
jgi:aminoglycoside phosphotransferase